MLRIDRPAARDRRSTRSSAGPRSVRAGRHRAVNRREECCDGPGQRGAGRSRHEHDERDEREHHRYPSHAALGADERRGRRTTYPSSVGGMSEPVALNATHTHLFAGARLTATDGRFRPDLGPSASSSATTRRPTPRCCPAKPTASCTSPWTRTARRPVTTSPRSGGASSASRRMPLEPRRASSARAYRDGGRGRPRAQLGRRRDRSAAGWFTVERSSRHFDRRLRPDTAQHGPSPEMIRIVRHLLSPA